MSGPRLRDYQEQALSAIVDADARGVRRQLLVMPTGSGKTVTFAAAITQRGGRALVLAHRKELLDQAAEKIRDAAPELTVGVVQGRRNDADADVVVASVQTAIGAARLSQLGTFDLIVVDEAHHAAADSYRRVLTALGAFTDGGPLTLGFTATPSRADGVGLDAVFEEVVFELPLLPMIASGHLSDITARRVMLLLADYRNLHVRAGDFLPEEVAKVLRDADGAKAARDAYRLYAQGRSTIMFCPTVDTSREFAACFNAAGISTAHVDADTPADERADLFNRYRAGQIRVLSNVGIATEGFDSPITNCVIIARPTKSAALYAQMIGRGLRLYPGKDDLLVLDLVGATVRHDLVSVADIVGLDVAELDSGTSVIAALEQRRLVPERVPEGSVVAQAVDILRAGRPGLAWVPVGRSFALSVDAERRLVLLPDGSGRWTVAVDGAGSRVQLATSLPFGYAQGTAEDYARAHGVSAFVEPSARWRGDPVTPKQLAMLRALGVAVPAGCTKGAASDLILAAKSQRQVA